MAVSTESSISSDKVCFIIYLNPTIDQSGTKFILFNHVWGNNAWESRGEMKYVGMIHFAKKSLNISANSTRRNSPIGNETRRNVTPQYVDISYQLI